jgi:hypothetical protein
VISLETWVLWVHILAAAAWLGGAATMLVAILPAPEDALAAAMRRAHFLTSRAMEMLVLTGLLNILLKGLDSNFTLGRGFFGMLSLKMALLVIMGGLQIWMRAAWRRDGDPGPQAARRARLGLSIQCLCAAIRRGFDGSARLQTIVHAACRATVTPGGRPTSPPARTRPPTRVNARTNFLNRFESFFLTTPQDVGHKLAACPTCCACMDSDVLVGDSPERQSDGAARKSKELRRTPRRTVVRGWPLAGLETAGRRGGQTFFRGRAEARPAGFRPDAPMRRKLPWQNSHVR